MIYVIHTDSRVRDFVADMLDTNKVEGNRTMLDSASIYDIKRIKDGDTVYGTLQMSQLLLPDVSFTYYNIVPPKQGKDTWKAWKYKVVGFKYEEDAEDSTITHNKDSEASKDVANAQAGIFLMGHEEFQVEAD